MPRSTHVVLVQYSILDTTLQTSIISWKRTNVGTQNDISNVKWVVAPSFCDWKKNMAHTPTLWNKRHDWSSKKSHYLKILVRMYTPFYIFASGPLRFPKTLDRSHYETSVMRWHYIFWILLFWSFFKHRIHFNVSILLLIPNLLYVVKV